MATKVIAWQTGSGNIILTYQGQGDGPISVQSDENDGAARSQVITLETTAGTPIVTKNVTVSQAACPFPVGDVKNFSYTGSYQEIELPAGQYKLQCWGAQGGSNGTNSTYGITAKAGGKGGYSEGIITLSQKTTVRVYVGGQGSSSAGGFNGGGVPTTGTSQNTSGNVFGYSKFGGGGGATDIRLSDGSLYSRMIVAGGGSGGAMSYRAETTTDYTKLVTTYTLEYSGMSGGRYLYIVGGGVPFKNLADELSYGKTYKIVPSTSYALATTGEKSIQHRRTSDSAWLASDNISSSGMVTVTSKQGDEWLRMVFYLDSNAGSTFTVNVYESETVTTTSTTSQVGYAGGGTTGLGYSDYYKGKQNEAGLGGSFGQGANQEYTNIRYHGGLGGGGWYGGGNGGSNSDTYSYAAKMSGGGSGFVNTYANRSYRPSGYTGLQLDSGETKAGNTSFPAPGGGNETGHSGNGYAIITRIA